MIQIRKEEFENLYELYKNNELKYSNGMLVSPLRSVYNKKKNSWSLLDKWWYISSCDKKSHRKKYYIQSNIPVDQKSKGKA